MRVGDILKTAAVEGKEKHVPHIQVKPCESCAEVIVTVIVGKQSPHANTV